MGAYGEHSSRLRNFEGFKLVTNLKETKEAKCNLQYYCKNYCMFMIIILYIAVIASAETYNTACGGHLAPLYAVKKH